MKSKNTLNTSKCNKHQSLIGARLLLLPMCLRTVITVIASILLVSTTCTFARATATSTATTATTTSTSTASSSTSSSLITTRPAAAFFTYRVTESILHDINSFTEGLCIRESDGALLESIGLRKQSKVLAFARRPPAAVNYYSSSNSRSGNRSNNDSSGITSSSISSNTGSGSGTAAATATVQLETIASVSLDSHLFGEGLTTVDQRVFQLVYKKRKIHEYDQDSLQLLRTFDAPKDLTEGWGLTTSADGEFLIMGNGSNTIFFIRVPPPLSLGAESYNSVPYNASAGQLVIARRVYVHDCANGMPQVNGLNELEIIPRALTSSPTTSSSPPSSSSSTPTASARAVGQAPWQHHQAAVMRESQSRNSNSSGDQADVIDDFMIWANVIGTHCVAVLDPQSGQVQAWIYLDGIYTNEDKFNKVSNGIVYDRATKSVWITGKLWPELHRIELNGLDNAASDRNAKLVRSKCKTPWRPVASKQSKQQAAAACLK